MQKDEQLRRRDPKAHTAMILGRKERDLRSFQQHAPTHSLPPSAYVYPMTSTQSVCWDAPMIATGDMLRPPSTAPDAASGTGTMLYAPLIANPSAAVSPNLDQPQNGSLPHSNFKAGEGASSTASEQTRSRDPGSGVNGHDVEMNGKMNGSKEYKGGEKRSFPWMTSARKKAKRAPAITANFASSGAMTKTFEDLLSREAARPSKGGV